jgi:hypothetical protein
MLNQPPDKNQSDKQWADQAVGDLLAGLKLNQRLVQDGVWDQLISDMETDGEVAAYGVFLMGLRDSYSVAKRVRKNPNS